MATIRQEALELALRAMYEDGSLDRMAVMRHHEIVLVEKLIRLARQYQRIQARRCNNVMDRYTEARLELTENRLRIKILALRDELKPFIGRITFNGDPRGYCIKLHLRSEAYNTLGGKESGYGIG
jgi:hypothetical protein